MATKSIPNAISIHINDLVYKEKLLGKDITTLSLGEAFFDLPQFSISSDIMEFGYHYSDSQGLPSLRKKICKHYKEKFNGVFDYNKNLLISSGSKIIIFMCLQYLLDKDDEAIIFEPAWLSYQHQINLVGSKPKLIPYDTPLTEANEFITNSTKVLIINNPNNPSGKVYTRNELITLYSHCLQHNIFMIVDEAYSDFVINDQFTSMTSIDSQFKNLIVINSLSKNFGLSGWRIGFMIANNTLIQNILNINQHLITCAPTVLQCYISDHFDELLKATRPQIIKLAEKRLLIENYIKSCGLKCLNGDTTFYFFIDLNDYDCDTFELSKQLLFKYQISVVPGEAYGKSTKKFIRISIGTETSKRICKAIDQIKICLQEFNKNKNTN